MGDSASKFAAVLALLCLLAVPACGRKPAYPRSSPDETIRSAVAMVKAADARRLGTLIYADSPAMREVLDRLGELLGHLQALSTAAANRFPEDIEALRERALSGKAASLISTIAGAARVGGGKGAEPDPAAPDKIREWVNGFLADPYGWIDRNAPRLTTQQSDDTSAFVLLDGKPAIPVVGLAMRLDERGTGEAGGWKFVLPTGVPPIAPYMPRSRQQWSIVGSLIRIVDRGVVELTDDVNAGRVKGLDDLAGRAQDKMMLPGVIAFTAYGREMDVRQRVDRRAGQFETRKAAWVRARREAESPVSNELLAAFSRIGAERIERAVRKKEPQDFKAMSDGEFEGLLAEWSAAQGLAVDFASDLSGPGVEWQIKAWQKRPMPAPAPMKRSHTNQETGHR